MKNDFILPAKEICYFLNITREGLRKWRLNPTFPKNARVKRGYYNLKEIFDWWNSYVIGDADIAKQLQAEKLKYQQARSLREKLEVEEMQRKLINLDLLNQDLTFIFLRMKSALLLWSKRLPPALEGKDAKSMYQVIYKEVYEILTNFSKGVKSLCKVSKRQ